MLCTEDEREFLCLGCDSPTAKVHDLLSPLASSTPDSGFHAAAMVSYAPSSSDRQTNGRIGAGNVNGKAEKPTAGTPRKDGGARREKAVQVPELKDYVGVYLFVNRRSTVAYTKTGSGRFAG